MPAHSVRFLLARRPALVAFARNRVSAQVRAWGTVLDADTQDRLDLLVSEVVTNSVLHARGVVISVGVHLKRGRLRIEVDDDSAQPPAEPAAEPPSGWEEESGRGLRLIAALASQHGWEPTHGGKRVWFELAVPEPTRIRSGAALPTRATRVVRRGGPARELRWPIPA